jgi:hypothetical protein
MNANEREYSLDAGLAGDLFQSHLWVLPTDNNRTKIHDTAFNAIKLSVSGTCRFDFSRTMPALACFVRLTKSPGAI